MNYRILKDHERVQATDKYAISLKDGYSWLNTPVSTHGYQALIVTVLVKEFARSLNAYIRREI